MNTAMANAPECNPMVRGEARLRQIEPTTPGDTAGRIVSSYDRCQGEAEQRAFVVAMASRLALRMCATF